MTYQNYRGDFLIVESFYADDGMERQIPVPDHVRIEYYTDCCAPRYTVEKNGDSYTRCSLSEDGMSLVCYIALSRYPVGMGNLLKHVVEIVGDEHFPDNEKCILTSGETGIVLFPGQSDGSGRIMSSFVLPVSQYGFSAYELAVRNGFQGTEEEWLQSLCGGAMPVLADTPANPVEGQFFFLKDERAVAVFNGERWRYALTVKNRKPRIVVGRAIPMYPEQNTAYVYPDGVLKVKIRRGMLGENGMDLSRFGKLGHAADEKPHLLYLPQKKHVLQKYQCDQIMFRSNLFLYRNHLAVHIEASESAVKVHLRQRLNAYEFPGFRQHCSIQIHSHL